MNLNPTITRRRFLTVLAFSPAAAAELAGMPDWHPTYKENIGEPYYTPFPCPANREAIFAGNRFARALACVMNAHDGHDCTLCRLAAPLTNVLGWLVQNLEGNLILPAGDFRALWQLRKDPKPGERAGPLSHEANAIRAGCQFVRACHQVEAQHPRDCECDFCADANAARHTVTLYLRAMQGGEAKQAA